MLPLESSLFLTNLMTLERVPHGERIKESRKGKVSTRPHPACRRHDLREPATMPGRLPLISKVKVKLLVTQWCPTLYKSMHCGPAGSSVHGILQAGILEWVAVPFSKESYRPRDQTGFPVLQADS